VRLATVTLMALTLLSMAACGGGQTSNGQPPVVHAPATVVERGRYLTLAGDCIACHTAPGGRAYAGGREFRLKMGTLYSPNITPDPYSGIGRWSDDDFVRAMQKGVAPDGSHYYPAFPYNYFTRLSREDDLAIKAYLFTLSPAQNRPPRAALRFPYSQRWLMVFWNALYNPNERFRADPSRSAEWNRGAYLTEGLGHCGACHTPMNILQGPRAGHTLGGQTLAGWYAYNISSDREHGIGGWKEADLVSYLSTGRAQGHGSASGPMAEAITYSLSRLTKQDIAAMAAYLLTVEAVADGPAISRRGTANPRPDLNSLRELPVDEQAGARIFAGACAGCHAWNGTGLQSEYATLLGSRSLQDPRATNLVQVILEGTRLQTPDGTVFMPPFAASYSDSEIASAANFIGHQFGNASPLTANDVGKRRRAE
jgi:mono/diheme cytochrome c family protein